MTHQRQQERALEQLWQLNRDRLLRGEAYVDPLLYRPEQDDRYCLTLVVKMPETLCDRLSDVQADLANRAMVYLYPPASIHFTIRGIYDYGHYQRNEAEIAQMAFTMAQIGREVGPLTISFRGVNVNRTAAFVQGFYADDKVSWVRAQLGERLASFQVAPLPTLDVQVDFVWINLLRFATPEVTELVDRITKTYRDTEFGTYTFNEMELLEIDKFYRPGRSRFFGRIVLG